MNTGPIEPSADVRAAAHSAREMFLALVHEGFTERQAMAMVLQLLAASIGGSTA